VTETPSSPPEDLSASPERDIPSAAALDVPPLPQAPAEPAVDAAIGRVELFDTGGLDWQPVSLRLITARTITLLGWLVPILVALVLGAVLATPWLWAAAGALALIIVWGLWLIRRQVTAMSYIELSDDLVVRKGRLFRQISSVPFGRLQYVDLQSGPLERKLGMATLQIFTASPSTSATIAGLPIDTAERMRERLMVRGEAQRAGL
jgi:membrane protein YdbS with pleckstrin-like domain